ncbi:hypothetical protein ETD86_01715 [Nonomuraea turkmeniaca]|uniref:ABC transporter permease n=1 Tax=Nonomuraea turkmeniaca TaxID=103838 RepID=A0A5S4FYZ0_9ACTN|nr:hypothetical protein [Nonomuraea turkmeniaca]TMR25331.1 hypothetical protein ETD86_01715 [Nonomuraea turkmeniaca]
MSIVCGLLGEVFGLPQTVRDLSPFSHVPPIPAAEVTFAPLAALVLTTAGLAAMGLALFRRRSLAL